jgi:hypothetical protein
MNRKYRNPSTIVTTMSQRLPLSFLLGVSILVFAAPSVAEADVFFTNFGAGQTYDITSGNPVGNAFDGSDYAEADTFTPLVSGKLQSLRLALSCAFSCPDAVTVSLDADAGDQPGAVLESFSVAAGALGSIGVNNVPLLLNSVLLPHLLAGVQYWVAVSSPLTDNVSWNLNTTGDVSDQAISSDGGATWFSPSGNTPGALEVDASTVPEPSSFALLAGVGLLVSRVYRRRRSQSPGGHAPR